MACIANLMSTSTSDVEGLIFGMCAIDEVKVVSDRSEATSVNQARYYLNDIYITGAAFSFYDHKACIQTDVVNKQISSVSIANNDTTKLLGWYVQVFFACREVVLAV